jgi:hypothetical protein
MGGRKETPPTIIMPAEGAPQAFQTIVPQKSYKDIAESTLRTEKEINRLMGQRYNEVGTPEEIGARKKGVEMQAAASYLASLPKGPVDERFKETPRAFPVKSNRRATFDTVPGSMSGFGSTRPGTGRPATGGTGSGQVGTMQVPTDPAKEAAKKRFDESKKAYEAALEKAKKTPRSFMAETKDPAYAQNPDSMFIPQIINAPDK